MAKAKSNNKKKEVKGTQQDNIITNVLDSLVSTKAYTTYTILLVALHTCKENMAVPNRALYANYIDDVLSNIFNLLTTFYYYRQGTEEKAKSGDKLLLLTSQLDLWVDTMYKTKIISSTALKVLKKASLDFLGNITPWVVAERNRYLDSCSVM